MPCRSGTSASVAGLKVTALPWSGVKNSGRGFSLSALGFDQLTRPKSLHYRLAL